MERLKGLGKVMMDRARRRPGAVLALGVALMGAVLGVVSCQTTPRAGMGAEHAGVEPDMRIRLKTGLASVKIGGAGQFAVQPLAGRPALMDGPVTVAGIVGGCRVTDARGVMREFTGMTPLDMVPAGGGAGESAARITVDGVSHPGAIRVTPRIVPGPNGPKVAASLDVIESLPMETYLAGVVGAELYKDWPLAAFEVQAVCARTYALHERERVRGRDYDLESTTADQVYAGGAQLAVAQQAVKNTRGVVVTWRGRLLRTYYSSTCGGRTASAADTWPTGPGYEFNLDLPIQAAPREIACESSPRFKWEAVRDRAELSRRIREWGRANAHAVVGVGLVSVVRVVGTNKDERPNRYEIEDDRGRRYSIGAEELRRACGQNVAGLPEVPREQRVWAGDMEFEVKGTKVTIRGRGFGHGVGMCQFCTKGFADRKEPWRETVLRYYPGAALERAY